MFVSIKEAVGLTGKSQTTISRLCSKKKHTKYVKKENNKYFINKEYLLATYPEKQEKEEDHNALYKRNVANTPPKGEIFGFEDEPTEFGGKIIDDISVKITKRYNEANNQDDTVVNATVIPWESIIGVSVGVLLIVGFILVLYLGTK